VIPTDSYLGMVAYPTIHNADRYKGIMLGATTRRNPLVIFPFGANVTKRQAQIRALHSRPSHQVRLVPI
jgi:hypothetical protein